tara:strand:+ start:169 stop:1062 length:894 start_codon:yes stop_codon:yes gene_type:complete
MMDYPGQLKAIATPPNPKVICKKQGMSYLEAYYVRLLANRIFGPTSVHITALEHSLDQSTDSGRVEVEYTCTSTIKILFANGEHRILMGTGGGRGYGPEAHQQAKMEAESHAYKRCMSNLGPAFGLTLYDGTNPLHNNGECCWIGFQEDRRSTPPEAGPPQTPDLAVKVGIGAPKSTPKPAPKAVQITEPDEGKWTDQQRKGFCASINRLGIQYINFKAFCIEELHSETPSLWEESDRGKALKDLAPGGKLRNRFMTWNQVDIHKRDQEREENTPYKPPARPPAQPDPDFNDDDIPF